MPFDFSVPIQYHGLLSTVGFRDVVDILLVAVILYKSYEMLKDTRAITLAKGMFVMMGVALGAYILELHAIYWLLSKSIYLLFMALPIVFQPELRRALERIGQGKFLGSAVYLNAEEADTLVNEIDKVVFNMSAKKIGALMVLERYDKLGDWNEETLAELRHSLDGTELEGYPGTTLNQAVDIFNGVGGFDIETTADYPDGIWMENIQNWLAEGKPVMICWNDWGGHWQIIIGYDTMGTETQQDDVFLVADSYDTTDHNQDGYGVYPAERLMYNFTMYGAFPEEEGGSDMLFLVASPTE